MFILDISDKANPRRISQWTNSPPYTGFMHTVVPNFARLGLITERTEPRYRACGIMWGDRFGTGPDADVQASLRN